MATTTKKAPATKAVAKPKPEVAADAEVTPKKKAYDANEDDRVEAVHTISATEVMVVRGDNKPAFRCHPDDIKAGLDEQDDPTIAPAGTK